MLEICDILLMQHEWNREKQTVGNIFERYAPDVYDKLVEASDVYDTSSRRLNEVCPLDVTCRRVSVYSVHKMSAESGNCKRLSHVPSRAEFSAHVLRWLCEFGAVQLSSLVWRCPHPLAQ